jgi:uncharacterized protein (DUF2141 family)
MNGIIKTGILLLSLGISTAAFAGNRGETLKVAVRGFENTAGLINVALFTGEKDFGNRDRMFRGVRIKPKGDESLAVFSELPAGDYAIAVFHDENENGKLDKNLVGIPKEAYGFSNDARGVFGPPSFSDAKVVLTNGASLNTIVNIK